jgi:hypothetical protein
MQCHYQHTRLYFALLKRLRPFASEKHLKLLYSIGCLLVCTFYGIYPVAYSNQEKMRRSVEHTSELTGEDDKQTFLGRWMDHPDKVIRVTGSNGHCCIRERHPTTISQ